MKKLLFLLALACLGSSPAMAQTFSLGRPVADTNPQPIKAMCWNGSAFAACAGTGTSAEQVQGNIASATTDSGNPVKIGCYGSIAAPSAVSAGQRSNVWCGTQGQVMVGSVSAATADAQANAASYLFTSAGAAVPLAMLNYNWNGTTFDRQRGDTNGIAVQPALSSAFWKYAAASGGIVNTATAVTVKAAAGASVRNYVMSMQCSHDTLGAATELAIRDGAAGTVMWRGRLQTAATDASGATINFEPPLQGTANTLTEIVTLTAVTGGVYCNLQGYTGS